VQPDRRIMPATYGYLEPALDRLAQRRRRRLGRLIVIDVGVVSGNACHRILCRIVGRHRRVL
jgi:hypothetical protein